MCSILGSSPQLPHSLPVTLVAITMSPLPLFTKLRFVPLILYSSWSLYVCILVFCAKKSVFFSHPEHNVVLFLLYPDFAFRDGCRPYIEVYQGDEKVKSTLGDYERMRIYHVSEGKVRNSEISFPIVTASKRSTFCTESLVLISIQYVLGKRMVLTD